MDVTQYGGRKGRSTNHYLIDYISFILYNQDLKEARAVLAAMVDFRKAFNRQDHAILITILADMEVPGWLLHIIMGFLTDRVLVVAYMGEEFQPMAMPGGGPWACFFFLCSSTEQDSLKTQPHWEHAY